MEDREAIPSLERSIKGLSFDESIERIRKSKIPEDIKEGLIEIVKEIKREHVL